MLDKFLKEIESLNAFLNDMPKTNTKNKQAYEKELVASIKKFKNIKEQVVNEIDFRYLKYEKIKPTCSLKKDPQIDEIYNKLELINSLNTSYEKSNLDNVLYNINHFYNTNLSKVNDDIIEAIKIFNEAGITIDANDFDYSMYAVEYMKNYFSETQPTLIQIKPIFEKIYWKCPNIIKHIDLSFRKIYLKNTKKFDNYFTKKCKEDKIADENNLKEELFKIIKEKDNLIHNDLGLLLKKFIDGERDIKDFQEEKILQLYAMFVNDSNADIKKYEAHNKDLQKLIYSLTEYINYLKYLFIIEDIKKIYEEKDKYKNICKNMFKDINKEESKLFKLNKKIMKKSKNNKEDNNLNILTNNITLNISNMYEEYEKNYFCEKVSILVNDNTTIYDALYLAASYDVYLIECIKKKYDGITEEDIEKLIIELKEFLLSPYNSLIDNIGFKDEVDIPIIIYDHFKMLNIKITSESINDSEIPNIIQKVNILLENSTILSNNIRYRDILYMIDAKKIIDDEKERI